MELAVMLAFFAGCADTARQVVQQCGRRDYMHELLMEIERRRAAGETFNFPNPKPLH